MNVVFIEEADRQYSDASLYYESQEPGLGKRFEEEVEWAIRWLVETRVLYHCVAASTGG